MAMNDQTLRVQTLSVWKDFFNYLSGKHLAQHFAQIVVTLLNFLELPPSKQFVTSSASPPALMMDIDIEMDQINCKKNHNKHDYFALTQNPITSMLEEERNETRIMEMDMDVDDEDESLDQGFLTQAPMSKHHNSNSKKGVTTNNAQIISLLKEIIVNKRDFTEQHYHEIPILPNVLELREISNVIQNSLGNQSLDSKLIHITSLLRNESTGIKKMALNTLLYTLQKHRKQLELVILSNMRYEPLLHNLMHSLLPLSTLKDNEILILCANCLGELGAIDFKVLHNQQSHHDAHTVAHEEKQVIVIDDEEDEDSDLEIIDGNKNTK
eukprot:368868_1